jgi:putative intracellular protease/amidase
VAKVLIPIPRLDFDPSEVAVSWEVLTQMGHRVVFATPDGGTARGDELMLTGEGLDVWGWIPGMRRVVAIGRPFRADRAARAAYSRMERTPEFRAPCSWVAASLDAVDGLLLPGGHRARGMRMYLESPRLQELCRQAFTQAMPVAAICHGVLLAARSIDPATGRSVLYGRKTTALTWQLERTAWRVARVTRFWDPTYYRTYTEEAGQPPGYMSVQSEVSRALRDPADFRDVDPSEPDAHLKSSGRARDSLLDERPAFVVCDGSYISARWPGDVHTFAKRFAEMLDDASSKTSEKAAPQAPSKPAA